MEDRLVMSAPPFTATAVSATQVDLSWGRVAGASLSRIYVEQPSITSWSLVSTVRTKTMNYTVNGLNPGTSYAFDIAYVKGGHQYLAAPNVATTLALPQAAPVTPHVSAIPVSSSEIQLMWNPVPNSTTYVISALLYDSGIETTQSWKVIGTLPYLDSLGTSPNNFTVVHSLSPGITYSFIVSAENSYGITPGNIVTATTSD